MRSPVLQEQDVELSLIHILIRAGAVAKDGIARKIGDNSSDNPKRMAAIREVSPVRPPSATPEAPVSYTHLNPASDIFAVRQHACRYLPCLSHSAEPVSYTHLKSF